MYWHAPPARGGLLPPQVAQKRTLTAMTQACRKLRRLYGDPNLHTSIAYNGKFRLSKGVARSIMMVWESLSYRRFVQQGRASDEHIANASILRAGSVTGRR